MLRIVFRNGFCSGEKGKGGYLDRNMGKGKDGKMDMKGGKKGKASHGNMFNLSNTFKLSNMCSN